MTYSPIAPEPPKKNRLWLILGLVGGGLVLLCICGVVGIGILTTLGGQRVSSVFSKINASLDTTPFAIDSASDPTPFAVDSASDATPADSSASDATPTPLAVLGGSDETSTPDEQTTPTEEATNSATEAPNVANADGTFTASDGQSQITGPTSWRDLTDLNANAELHVGNKIQEQYLIVLTEDKSTANVKDLADYAGLVRDGFTTNFPNAKVSEPRDLTINGLPAKQYQVRATVTDVAITYWFTAVEGKNNFFQIVGWTLQEDEAKNRDVIEQAIESFQELAP